MDKKFVVFFFLFKSMVFWDLKFLLGEVSKVVINLKTKREINIGEVKSLRFRGRKLVWLVSFEMVVYSIRSFYVL